MWRNCEIVKALGNFSDLLNVSILRAICIANHLMGTPSIPEFQLKLSTISEIYWWSSCELNSVLSIIFTVVFTGKHSWAQKSFLVSFQRDRADTTNHMHLNISIWIVIFVTFTSTKKMKNACKIDPYHNSAIPSTHIK